MSAALLLVAASCSGTAYTGGGGSGGIGVSGSGGNNPSGGNSGSGGVTPSGGNASGGNASGGANPSGGSNPTGGVNGSGGSTGGRSATGGSGTGGAPVVLTPIILSFAASSPSLPAGGGQTTLSWNVQNADSVSIDKGVGVVTGTSKSVNVTATTIFTLTATNKQGSTVASTSVVIGQNASSGSAGRFVLMVAPAPSETFLAPTNLRLVAAGRDPKIDTNTPSDGLGGNAAQVQFFADDQNILTVEGSKAEYWVFKGFAGALKAGQHRIWARATYTNPDEVLDSPPILITVSDPPTYAKTVDLTEDMAVGSAGFSLVGTATARVRLNGHGHSLTGTGPLTLQYVDVYDLGSSTDTGKYGLDFTTSGNVVIESSSFENCNPLSVSVTGTGTASIRRNSFHSNMRQPLGGMPGTDGGSHASYPAVHLTGNSTGAKAFAGNNMGAGWVEFVNTQGWVVGGDTDADSNIAVGPRVGIYTNGASNMTIRRNYTRHVYVGGWSQGSNYDLFGISNSLIEHNVVQGSSWPVRGGGNKTEFRYNLVIMAGHEWMQPKGGTSVHHNLFVGGDQDQGGFYIYKSSGDTSTDPLPIYNNTFDCLGNKSAGAALRINAGSWPVSVSSNAFISYTVNKQGDVNPTGAVVTLSSGADVTSDYNGFFATSDPHYADGRSPANDFNAADAQVTNRPTVPFDLDDGTIWSRATTVSQILSLYRTNYGPKSASPLLGRGDPKTTASNWIGAIGNGQGELDRFGRP